MLIIGERINTSRKSIRRAVDDKDIDFIKRQAQAQVQAGAGMLDINCGTSMDKELDDILWLVDIVQNTVDVPLCIDSPNPKALETALKICKKRPLVNSITLENDRFDAVLPLIKRYNTQIVALTLDRTGMPSDTAERVSLAQRLLGALSKEGVKPEDIYFDPLVRPIASEPNQALEFLKAIGEIKKLGNVKIIGGLSNVSFGLPERHLINAFFLSMAIAQGLDAALIDPLDPKTMASVFASSAIAGCDNYCANYIKAFRANRLKF